MSYSDRMVFSAPVVDFNSDQTALVIFSPLEPVYIHRVGISQTGASQTGTTSVVFAKRVGASTDATIATVVTLASTVGKVLYKETTDGTAANSLLVGDRVIVTSTKTGTSTPAVVVVEYSLADNRVSDNTNAVLSA